MAACAGTSERSNMVEKIHGVGGWNRENNYSHEMSKLIADCLERTLLGIIVCLCELRYVPQSKLVTPET